MLYGWLKQKKSNLVKIGNFVMSQFSTAEEKIQIQNSLNKYN